MREGLLRDVKASESKYYLYMREFVDISVYPSSMLILDGEIGRYKGIIVRIVDENKRYKCEWCDRHFPSREVYWFFKMENYGILHFCSEECRKSFKLSSRMIAYSL